ncbi:DNA-binding protein [Thermococcus sp. P6]|uniref:HEPN domain-containing protein n=1 Tax=Thermococcus sp. P6 TaxID=122420 RepID=UPI000B59DEC4|nr:HEPN domain-containing protein [Thermococcus sp. P6]ASJ10324.1 DNA-binding protein [Thermococcus sp. P6]
MFKESEYERWMKEARRTLKSAYLDLQQGYYEWASFKSQQAGELAVKAILRGLGLAPVGHSITRLFRELKDRGFGIPKTILYRAMELDRNYITPRYPDAYPEGSPYEYYSEEIARELVSYAETIIKFVEGLKDELGRT